MIDDINPLVVNEDDDGFEVLPSKPLTLEDKEEIYKRERFNCPVCGETGGPTFGVVSWSTGIHGYGTVIPSDHENLCLRKLELAYSYAAGRLSTFQKQQFQHNADVSTCDHPHCVAERVWNVTLSDQSRKHPEAE